MGGSGLIAARGFFTRRGIVDGATSGAALGAEVGSRSHRTSTFLNCQGSDGSISSGKNPGPVRQRRPVGVAADHRAEIRRLDFEATAEVHFVGLDNAGPRVLERPDHAGEHGRSHLHAGRVLIRGDLARLLDRKLRAVPIGVALMAEQQNAEFIDAVDNLRFAENVTCPFESRRRGRTFRARTEPRHCKDDRRSGRSADRSQRLARRAAYNSRRSKSTRYA